MSAPELFIIAADLTQMQVNASIDESDVGRMRPGQVVTFRVDAYPNETFHGSVKQVRLNPVTVQNVVTYSTVIDVPNPELKLKPGMTAQVTIEIARRENALRIPNAALRFRPTKDIFDALNQAMPPELERGFGRGRGGSAERRGAGGSRSGGAPAGGTAGAPLRRPVRTRRPAGGRRHGDAGQPAATVAAEPAARAERPGQRRRTVERPGRRAPRVDRRRAGGNAAVRAAAQWQAAWRPTAVGQAVRVAAASAT